MSSINCQVMIFVPMDEEFAQIASYFKLEEDLSAEFDTICYTATLPPLDLRFLLCKPRMWGNAESQMLVQELLERTGTRVIFCVGIAGAISDDLNIGDVAVSNAIFDVSERQKLTDKGAHFDTDIFQPAEKLAQRIAFLHSHPKLSQLLGEWQLDTINNLDRFLREAKLGVQDEADARALCSDGANFLIGAILSGPVGQSSKFKRQARAIKRKMLALETESGGVARAAARKNIPMLTIRGISDLADESKNKTEGKFKNALRAVAARNAASFLIQNILKNEFFQKELKSLVETASEKVKTDPVDKFDEVVTSLTEEIEEKLKKYSAEYRAKPKGYKLPVPRVREISAKSKNVQSLEPGEVIAKSRLSLIEIPINYPEKSLPWIYADFFIKGGWDGKIVLPVIIDYETLGPPAKGFSRELDRLKINGKTEFVYLIYNIQEVGRQKLEFIISEFVSSSSSKFILFGTTAELEQISSAQLVATLRKSYNVVDVSFLALTKFLSSNFEIQLIEAEVIALRLKETFAQFDLTPHPSYFAAISREALSALISAHRRAELINLAVSGYITHSRLLDQGRTKLSITTRREFLRKLAADLYVELKEITTGSLVADATEYAREMDFDIDIMKFIDSFYSAGILESNAAGRVSFSLPFVKSYLLAEELKAKEADALKYFDFDSPAFDHQTYDVFCEMGRSDQLYERLLESVSKCVKTFEAMEGLDPEMYFSEKINPKILRDSALADRLEKAMSDSLHRLVDGTGQTEEKQKMLDAYEEARAEASIAMASHAEKTDDEDTDFDFVVSAVSKYLVAIITLSAGSETLSATDKRELVRVILRLGGYITAFLLKRTHELDIERAVEGFRSSAFFQKYKDKAGKKDSEEFMVMVERLFHFAELEAMSRPFAFILSSLGEGARSAILFKSVLESETSTKVEELMRSIWLCEINPDRGVPLLKKDIKHLPSSRFVRTGVAQYFIMRAFWKRDSAKDKSLFAEVAADTMARFSDVDSQKILDLMKTPSSDRELANLIEE
ncbi:hypothetical protein ABCW43_01825 [Neorhizobium sp. IRAMC:178]|uniref:5'-methylthioadenosine/S-adenosylhomocysteine nucleosidase family protein n=1 Tax=Neorhizobium tunisiense TaxID=3144793 RepID=UPI0031F70DBF